MIRRRADCFTLLCALAGCSQSNMKPAPDIVLGVVAPLTGPQAAYGVATKAGVDLALLQQNKNGGVFGRRLKSISIDDQGQPAGATAAGERLVSKEKVAMIIGGVSSLSAMALAKIAQRAQTPMISPSATDPAVTASGDRIFRVCFTDPFQGQAMAKFAKDRLKIQRAAVLKDLGSAYSIRLAEAFAAQFEALGGKIVATEHYQSDDKDLRAPIEKIQAAGAQALYAPGYHREIKRLLSAPFKAPRPVLLGSDGWDTRELLELPRLEGSYFTTHYSPDDPRPQVKAFTDAYREVFNERPDTNAALGYDAARFAIAAMKAAGSADHSAVQKTLTARFFHEGVTGALKLDRDRNAIKPAIIVKIEGGQSRYADAIGPLTPSPSLAPADNASK